MKKSIIIAVILLATISSLLGVEVKVGSASIGKYNIQVCPYDECRTSNGRLVYLRSDQGEKTGRLVRNEETDEWELEELGKDSIVPYIEVSSEGDALGFNYDVSVGLAFHSISSRPDCLRYGLSIGKGNSRVKAYLSINGESYTLFDVLTEDYLEMGGMLRIDEEVFDWMSVRIEAGAYLYPYFQMTNVETTRLRESTSSVCSTIRADFHVGGINAYVGGGLKSWQFCKVDEILEEKTPVGNFFPVQIRNLFCCGASVDFGGIGMSVDYDYFCDHPENPNGKNMPYTNSTYGLLTLSATVKL